MPRCFAINKLLIKLDLNQAKYIKNMIWNISWKNVWRNKSRSMIVICAVTLGTISGIFVAGMMNGWVNQRVHAAIYTEVSHLKIQNPKYLINEELIYTVPQYNEIAEYLNQSEKVKAWTKHSKVITMASTSRASTAITLKGINVNEEKQATPYSIVK